MGPQYTQEIELSDFSDIWGVTGSVTEEGRALTERIGPCLANPSSGQQGPMGNLGDSLMRYFTSATLSDLEQMEQG